MKSKKLLAAVVAAITMLVGGLGMALWPSSAGATGAIRKFSGPIMLYGNTSIEVRVHNPHATATLKPSVVLRDANGIVLYNHEHPVGPHKVVVAQPYCYDVCTVEVNMTNAILQPSIRYYSFLNSQYEHVYAGDFTK